MDNVLSVGLAGCGQIGSAHGNAFQKASNVELSMVMDTNEEACKEFGEKYDVEYTTNYDKMVARADIDIISLAVPHFLHAPMAIKAAQKSKHVMVEKPLCTTMKDARRMIKTYENSGLKMTMWFPSRYSGVAYKVKELLAQGVIGRIMYTKITTMGYKEQNYWERGVGGRARKSDWRRYLKTAGGGILIMNTIHDIDRMRYMLGYEVTGVYAQKGTFASPAEVEDLITVSIDYANGAIGYIESSSWAVGRSSDPTRIYGTEGQISFNPLKVYLNRKIGDYPQKEWFEPEIGEVRTGRTPLVEDFVDAILSGKRPPITGEDGLKALEIVLGAYKSDRLRRRVELPIEVI